MGEQEAGVVTLAVPQGGAEQIVTKEEEIRNIIVSEVDYPTLFDRVRQIKRAQLKGISSLDEAFGGLEECMEDGLPFFVLTGSEFNRIDGEVSGEIDESRAKAEEKAIVKVGENMFGKRVEGTFYSDVFIEDEVKPRPVMIDPDLVKDGEKIYVIYKRWQPPIKDVSGSSGYYLPVIAKLEKVESGGVGFSRLTPPESESLLEEVVTAIRTGDEIPKIHTLGVVRKDEIVGSRKVKKPKHLYVEPEPLSINPIKEVLLKGSGEEGRKKFARFVESV